MNLVGAVEQGVVIEALKNSDVFVLPCVIEKSGTMDGIPVALMEAMALGVPVVSTRVSGIPELIDNKTGILAKTADSDDLENALNNFFNLQNEEIMQLTNNARKKIENEFNIKIEAKKLASHFYSDLN
mgnify:CR=1 FL=1